MLWKNALSALKNVTIVYVISKVRKKKMKNLSARYDRPDMKYSTMLKNMIGTKRDGISNNTFARESAAGRSIANRLCRITIGRWR